MEKTILAAGALSGYPEEVGRWLWALEDVRKRTLRIVRDLDQRTLDWQGPRGDENSIGTLLYHIAIVEMDWLFMDLHEGEPSDAVRALFPYEHRTQGRLTAVMGVPAADHVALLDRTRAVLLADFTTMSLQDWSTVRHPQDEKYVVSPDWVIFHLVEHEAGHTAQIGALIARAGRFFAG